MTKVTTTLKCLPFIFWILLLSCQKNGRQAAYVATAAEDLATSGQFQAQAFGWQPQGSSLKWTGSNLEVTPPKGWAYAGFDAKGNLLNMTGPASKSVSCTCNNSSGECRPFEATLPLGGGSISGCAGACTNCTMTQGYGLEKETAIVGGGYYAINARTRLLRDGETAPAVFDGLFELEAFKTALKRFSEEAYHGKPLQPPVVSRDGTVTAPMGHCLVAVSILGRAALVVVPEGYGGSQLGYIPMTKASCSCDKGTCTLKDKTVAGMGLVYCQGACSTCTLTTSNLAPNTAPYLVKLQSYQY